MATSSGLETAFTRTPNRASAVTINRIILEAARLFADQGIDRVSLREIAVAAGLKNTNAVNYHFGDRESLILAISHFYTFEFEPLRAQMIALATAQSRHQDVRTLLEILVLPYLTVVSPGGAHHYVAFVNHTFMRSSEQELFYPFINDTDNPVPVCKALLATLRERLISLPEGIFRARIRAAIGLFVSAIVRWDNLHASGATPPPLEITVLDSLSQMTAAVNAPYHYDGQAALLDLAKSFAVRG